MAICNELIDELLAGRDPALVMRHDGLLGELKQALLNRLMAAEFDHHMDQERAAGKGRNHRNGATRKRVLAGEGHVEVTIPRDREARFEPVLPAPQAGRCLRVSRAPIICKNRLRKVHKQVVLLCHFPPGVGDSHPM